MPAGLFFGFLGVLSELELSASSRDSSMALACSFLRNLKGVVDGPTVGTPVEVDGASATSACTLLIMARVRSPMRAGGGSCGASEAAAAGGMFEANEEDGLDGGIEMGRIVEASGSSMVTRIKN